MQQVCNRLIEGLLLRIAVQTRIWDLTRGLASRSSTYVRTYLHGTEYRRSGASGRHWSVYGQSSSPAVCRYVELIALESGRIVDRRHSPGPQGDSLADSHDDLEGFSSR